MNYEAPFLHLLQKCLACLSFQAKFDLGMQSHEPYRIVPKRLTKTACEFEGHRALNSPLDSGNSIWNFSVETHKEKTSYAWQKRRLLTWDLIVWTDFVQVLKWNQAKRGREQRAYSSCADWKVTQAASGTSSTRLLRKRSDCHTAKSTTFARRPSPRRTRKSKLTSLYARWLAS